MKIILKKLYKRVDFFLLRFYNEYKVERNFTVISPKWSKVERKGGEIHEFYGNILS